MDAPSQLLGGMEYCCGSEVEAWYALKSTNLGVGLTNIVGFTKDALSNVAGIHSNSQSASEESVGKANSYKLAWNTRLKF